MNNTYVLIGMAIMSLVTVLLRFIPFIFLSDKKEYKTLNYLSKYLPCAVMGMLVVYCLKDTSFSSAEGFVPALIASFTVGATYIWKRKPLFSILTGTVLYMFLIKVVF